MLCWVFTVARAFLPLWTGGYSLAVVLGLLTVGASLVAEEGLQGMQASVVAAHGLSSICGSWSLGHRLNSYGAQASCSEAYGIFLDQGRNPCRLHWQVDSSPVSYHRSPSMILLNYHVLKVKTLASPSPFSFFSFLSFYFICHPKNIQVFTSKLNALGESELLASFLFSL